MNSEVETLPDFPPAMRMVEPAGKVQRTDETADDWPPLPHAMLESPLWPRVFPGL